MSEFNGGHYEIIGLWDGVDYATGMLNKGIRQNFKPRAFGKPDARGFYDYFIPF